MQNIPDLDGCMGGKTYNATVSSSSIALVPTSTAANRRGVTIVNRDATNPIYLAYGFNDDRTPVTAASTANASLVKGEAITLQVRNQIFAIAPNGDVSVDVYIEEDQA